MSRERQGPAATFTVRALLSVYCRMNENPPYLAVVPAYNEAATVGRVIRSIREHAPLYDVAVIDDGSTDATAAEAEAAGAKVIRHPYNLGIGGAVQSGFTYALENGYRRLVQGDADGQHEPREVAQLEAALDEDPPPRMVCGPPVPAKLPDA